MANAPEEAFNGFGEFLAANPQQQPQLVADAVVDVLVEFRDGRAWWMRVVKRGLRETEREAVMAGANVEWEGPEEIKGQKYWRSGDGKLHAVWVQVESVGSLELLTDACLEARKKLQKRRERLVGTKEGDAVYGKTIGKDPHPPGAAGVDLDAEGFQLLGIEYGHRLHADF